ncbi:MFS transporter [Allokutzneria sp. A3M-2-11 16]|uniref:MFS transporter n=1 Tax=Allokutzneria sp. A3M-2-11 16 TaxID=2962043 RepID=UPI0020B70D78|nr:MFS transporter [Allokutzneria sp. A3M-2-11 16]MCP3804855.1 MFS transporter [Allokutzneria sp. A3M-2-11 16]
MPLPLLSLMLCVFSVTTAEFVIAGILPDVATGLSVSIPAAGLLVTAYALAMVVGGPVLTVLTTRIARKPLIVGLIGVFVLGNLVAMVAPNYPVLLVSRVVSGLVVATFFAVAVVIAVSMAPPGKQASTVAKLALGMNLATILGAPIGTVIGQNFGWRSTFLAIAVFSVLALVLVLRLVPMQPTIATGSALADLRVLRDRNVQLAIAVTAVGNAGILVVFTYIAPLLTDVSGFAAGSVAPLLLVYGVGATIGNLVGGWLSDRALMPSLLGLLGVLTGALVLCWLVSGSQVLTAGMVFVIGALAFAIIPGMQTRVIGTASAAPTLGIAVNASAFQLANAFAAWLGGVVIDSGLGLRSIYLVGALVTVAGVLVVAYSWARDRRLAPAVPVQAAD